MHLTTRALRRSVLAATTAAAATLMTACGAAQPDILSPVQVSAQAATDRSAQLVYDLGETAFAPPGLDGKRTELKAEVTYPRRLDKGKHPLLMMLHGMADTCSTGDKPLRPYAWPCGNPSGSRAARRPRARRCGSG
ncbi:hypothetical protein AB0M39_01490 [Streptomyces sp. NPDC051907]|uniref:hypothetical protein n=1 Tax=Streptomyces sp. NPDC051907 TaxID=3155284 RepID=UPI00343BC2F7